MEPDSKEQRPPTIPIESQMRTVSELVQRGDNLAARRQMRRALGERPEADRQRLLALASSLGVDRAALFLIATLAVVVAVIALVSLFH